MKVLTLALLAFFALPTFAQNSPMNLAQIRAWATWHGTVKYPGQTDDGRECEFNIVVPKGQREIYLSLGRKLVQGGRMGLIGGYLENVLVVGPELVKGSVDEKQPGVQFDQVGADDLFPQEKIQATIQLQKGPYRSGFDEGHGHHVAR